MFQNIWALLCPIGSERSLVMCNIQQVIEEKGFTKSISSKKLTDSSGSKMLWHAEKRRIHVAKISTLVSLPRLTRVNPLPDKILGIEQISDDILKPIWNEN